ncbi:MAG: BTAD domain-containing putative transcriptional regulator, partial [Chloroflexota bacterium]
MTRLNLRFLGSFGVQLDKQEVTHFRSTNVQGLLLYLSLQPDRAFNREVLSTLFWPEVSQSNAKTNLRQCLHRLRKILPQATGEEPFLFITRKTVQFNVSSDYTCDVHAFEQLFAAGKESEAMGLYKGELAAGFTADSLEFEEWFRLEREYLHTKAINALKELAVKEMGSQNYQAAQEAAQRHLQLDPWNEQAHRSLMLALALSGDRSGALNAYDNCLNVLYEELGIDPEAETIALSEKIETGELDGLIETVEVEVAPPQTLNKSQILDRLEPLPDQKLFGIEKPLAKAVEAVAAETRPWLVALDGLGGIGKTTLANEVVHHFLETDRFLDIAWVSAKQEEYVSGK